MIRTSSFFKYRFCNYYKTLNLDQDATANQIRKNFTELAKKYHPDTTEIPNEEFVKIKQAYDTLKDPDLRRQYDYKLIHGDRGQRVHYYYYPQQSSQTNSKKASQKAFNFLKNLGVFALVAYCLKVFVSPITDHELRRQNIILANQDINSSPSVQQKRRKIYEQQMKDKKITSKIITLKVSDSSKQSTKAKNARKNSLETIGGITKQKILEQPIPTEEYM